MRQPDAPVPLSAANGARFAVIVSRFNEALTSRLASGAAAALREAGAAEGDVEIFTVPGAFELPQAARCAAETGRFDAIVCVGCVIRGETPHFGYVCDAAASGLIRVSLDTGVPCTFGVLTCDTQEQADARSGGAVGNKGQEAADAAVAMINLIAAARG